MKKRFTISLISLSILGCSETKVPAPVQYPDVAEVNTSTFLADVKGVKVNNSGFGSSMVLDPKDASVFYMLTDRGPNVDGAAANSKVFSNPTFAPQIGKFRLKGTELVLESTIELKNENGTKLTGLPNPVGQGNSGETAYDLSGNILPTTADGIDSKAWRLPQMALFG